MEELDQILDHLAERVCRYRVDDLVVTYCNRSWAVPFGRTAPELVGTPLHELLTADELSDLRAQVHRLEVGGHTLRQETPRLVDGALRWEQWVDKLLVREDGAREVLAVARDVTARVEARTRQRETEIGLRATLDAINAGVLVIDAGHGSVVYVNAVFAAMLGRDIAEIEGRDSLLFVAPEMRETVRARHEAIGRGEDLEPMVLEMPVDGRPRWMHFAERRIPFRGRDAVLVTARDVTAQTEREARAYALLDNLPSAVIARSDDDTVEYANRATAELLGFAEPDDLIGRSLDELVHPDDAGRTDAALAELRYVRADGTVRFVETRTIDLDIAGEVTALDVLRDVTTEREALAALAGSERQLASVFDAVRDGVIAVDPAGVVVTANRAAAELLGVNDVEMLVGTELAVVVGSIAADDAARRFAGTVHRRVLVDGESIPRDAVVLDVGADRRTFELGMAPITEFGVDRPVGAVATVRDVTRERELHEQLEASKRRFQLLAEDAPIGIATLDPDGSLGYANPAQLRLMGFDHLPSRAEAAAAVHPDDMDQVAQRWMRAVELQQQQFYEVRYIWPTGDVRNIEAFLVPLSDGEMLLTHVDVTVRRELEQKLAHQATHDPLTGLPNRALLMDRVEQALSAGRREGRWPTVLFCDLDRFKAVNDRYGHAAGDELLRRVSDGLTCAVREVDTVARLGGDEFVVLCSATPDVGDVDGVAERIIELMSTPFVLANGVRASIGVSVGIATANEQTNAASLLRRADLAVYDAKSSGRGRAVRFDPSRHEPDAPRTATR
ncbi:MAG: PAS domain S-box protein [Actinomycetota bacterium]|nr:PAS domain S-box protein [Actinomycetota bacterium]